MIIKEIRTLDGVQYNYYYSNANRYVVNENGDLYDEVYDPINIERSYTEGELKPIDDPTEEEFAQAGRIMMGYEDNG